MVNFASKQSLYLYKMIFSLKDLSTTSSGVAKGQVEARARSAGLGSASTHFLQSFKTRSKQKFRPNILLKTRTFWKKIAKTASA